MIYSIQNKKTLIFLACFLLYSKVIFSAEVNSANNYPLQPRVSISGTSGTNTFGEGDVMIPFLGNTTQSIYSDIAAKYGEKNAWFASLGLGGRKIYDEAIIGAYFFGDYNRTPDSNYFTVLNPGIEFMTNKWDGHLNGYIPVNPKTKFINVSNSSEIFFSGHAQYQRLSDLIETVGSGADVEIGYTFLDTERHLKFFRRGRAFIGSYYFSPKYASNINGVEAGLELPLKKYNWASIELRDSYDNVNHNTFALTLRLTFDGLDKTGKPNIHDRMLDRIPRHLGNLYNGNGIPSETKLINTGKKALLQNNIWFFNPDVSSLSYSQQSISATTSASTTTMESCTFEHPCTGITQSNIDAINVLSPNANFYLNSGTYNNALSGGFNFYNGQNIFGRMNNFSSPATGNNRPLINDSLFFNGNNTASNLRINGNTIIDIDTGTATAPFQVGIFVTPSAVGTINIVNSDVTSSSNSNNVGAMVMESDNAVLNIENTSVFANVSNITPSTVIAVGVANIRNNEVNINDSSVVTSSSDTVNNGGINIGIVNNEAGIININNSSATVSVISGGLSVGVLNNSTIGTGGTININGLSILVTGDDANIVAGLLNQANNIANHSGKINADQIFINVVSRNGSGGTAAGAVNSGDGTTSIVNAKINVAGDSGNVLGISNETASTVNFANTIISVDASGTATGLPIQNNSGTLNDRGANTCFANGSSVPCI